MVSFATSSLAAAMLPAQTSYASELIRPQTTLLTNTGLTALAACWRGPSAEAQNYFGVLSVDWEAGDVRIESKLALPSRPHGVCQHPNGMISVIGMRPGQWIIDTNQQSQLLAFHSTKEAAEKTYLNGHAVATSDGGYLLTTETDLQTGAGVISVRDAKSLRKLSQFLSGSIEPHHLLLDSHGFVWVANGGLRRDANDKKLNVDDMQSCIAKIHFESGRLETKLELSDRYLSLRHLAWQDDQLGVAMQAEHPNAFLREQSPVFSVVDGDKLQIPTQDSDSVGYAGDIAACKDGFAFSSNRSKQVLHWRSASPTSLNTIAKVTEPFAMASDRGAVLIAAALGIARWHPDEPPRFLKWPEPMAIDNHWVTL